MLTLFIANKNYSSWSLRPWVALRAAGVPFEERMVPFHDHAAWDAYRAAHPSGLVPLLVDGDEEVWESLAIVEHVAERHPALWPADRAARSFARSAAAEMHAGFAALRDVCAMNCGVRARVRSTPEAVTRDLRRLSELWRTGLARFGGPFLAGAGFTAADAFFCPVAFRVQTYALELPDAEAAAYVARLLDLPAMRRWYAEALAETFRDPPHDAEIEATCTVVADLRAPAEAPA